MLEMKDFVKPGISATMLYPGAFSDETRHLEAVKAACALPDYEILDLSLLFDPDIRAQEMDLLRHSGKQVYLNAPTVLQQDGGYNPCSDDPETRQRALALMLDHIRYAGELEAPVMVYTANVDRGEAQRPVLLDRFFDFVCQCDKEAQNQGVVLALEPIERHRFKKLFLGPTEECCAFTERLRAAGCRQAGIMVDITHLPLMEEDVPSALTRCMELGMCHIHLGSAVLEPSSPFYGHTHPPMGIEHGLFDTKELAEQLQCMIRCGYIASGKRAAMSFEVQPLPGSTPEETAAVQYEKLKEAFSIAAYQEQLA